MHIFDCTLSSMLRVRNPSPYIVFYVFFIYIFIYLFVSLYKCLNIIHNQFLIISVADYQTVHVLLSLFILWHLAYAFSCLLISHIRDTLYT